MEASLLCWTMTAGRGDHIFGLHGIVALGMHWPFVKLWKGVT